MSDTQHDEQKDQHDEQKDQHEDDKKPKLFHIKIDRAEYEVAEEEMTGAQLRQLPPSPIGPDRDLFEVVPGQSDRKLADTDVVEISNGKRFFTAPAHINPGKPQGRA